MTIRTEFMELQTNGNTHIIDITEEASRLLQDIGLKEGSLLISAIGSTTGITTIEFEPGLVHTDMAAMYAQIAPYGLDYRHNKTWGDDNGAAHLRSAITGTSQAIPFSGGQLILGTWQQIVFIDFDTRSRSRRVVLQFTGL